MTRLTNSFDGGTDGVTITTANSGGASGNALDNVTSATSTLIYNAANAYQGGMCLAIDQAASDTGYVQWDSSLGTVGTVFARVYCLWPVSPTEQVTLIAFRDSGTATNCARIIVRPDGTIRLIDALGTTVATWPGKLTDGSYTRLEVKFVGDAVAGIVELKVFQTPSSSTPTDTITATGINTLGTIDRIRIGQTSTVATDNPVFYIDEIGVDTAGYLGSQSLANITPALLDGSGTPFTPKVNRNVKPALLDQSGTPFTPNVRRGINVGLLDVSATLFAFGEKRVVGSSSAFQNNAFQNDAFQTGQVFFVDGSPTLFTPRATQTVTVPGPSATGAPGFQTDAFQSDAFQMGGASTGIDGSGVVYEPTANLGVVGARTIFATLLDVSGVLFAPNIPARVTVDLLNAAGQLFTPGGGNIVSFGGDVTWDSPLVTWDDPGVVWDAGGGGAGLLDVSGQVFAPKTNESITVGLIDQSPQLFAPSPGASAVSVGLLSATPTVFIPAATFTLVVDLLDASAEVYEFGFPPVVTPDLLDASGVLTAPSVNPQYITGTPFIDDSGIVYDPSVNESVTLDLLDASGVLLAPFVGPVVVPDLLDASAQVFLPSLERVFLDLLDGSAEVFEPDHINIPFSQTIRLDDDPSQFLDAIAVVFAPDSIELAPPQFVTVPLLDASGQLIAPSIFLPTRPVIRLRARYDPLITLRAHYRPVITKRAQLARQG